MQPQYSKLIQKNPKDRMSPDNFISRCREPNGFFKNSFIDAMLFLEEIQVSIQHEFFFYFLTFLLLQIKEANEKNRFFQNLDNHLDSFPSDVCKNKILPQLVNDILICVSSTCQSLSNTFININVSE